MPADDKSRTRRRNRSETEARILAAAERLIARDGFTGFGVNALAAEAGYDKKLIARYFGGAGRRADRARGRCRLLDRRPLSARTL
ncbi:MAG: helix-turn-helix transcriptional regulator [Rhodomicrobium sp.]|nr:helix-turn-helix transcriptional regulator [Rhodomicrobium sp.]